MEHEQGVVDAILVEHLAVAAATRATLRPAIAELARHICEGLDAGGRLIVFGNGGSAADAQHFAAELTGRFRRARPALPAIALTANTSPLTASANDFSFDEVFERQVQACCATADVVVGISTSGGAVSVARGLLAAREQGARTWAMTGAAADSRVAQAAEFRLCVPSEVTARVQEMHITVIHAVSELIDAHAAGERA